MEAARDIKLDESGDLAFEQGAFQLVGGVDSIAQHVKIRLRFFLGEWFLDESRGIPYFQHVFVKNPSLPLINSIFQKTIIETPGIKALLDCKIALDRAARKLTGSYRASTDCGEIENTISLP